MSIDDATIRQRYDLDDTSSWSLSSARRTVSGLPNHASLVTTLLYRPFDLRPYFHHASVVDRPRDDVMKHLRGDVSQSNLALVVGRQGQAVGSHDWEVCFVSSHIVDQNIYRRGSGQVFPLYLSPSEMEKQMGEERRPNFSVSWLRQLSEAIGCVAEAPHSLPQGVSAEEVFAYIYAVLHAPTYRARYAPFLRIDFPRVPLPRDAAQFAQLGQLGWQLIALHTLDAKAAPVLNEPRHKFNEGEGNVVVKARVRHDENTKRVTINGGAWFEDVEGETWAFRVGGYTPAERWLKERDGRALTYDDQAHYRRLLIAQSETLLVLPAIDAALGLAAGEADDFLESTP